MKNFFLDTNIVIDVLTNRKPFSEYGERLFDLAYKKQIKLFISSVSYTTIYYYIRKTGTSHPKTISILKDLVRFIETTDVTKETVHEALYSEFKDFEDAIQHYSASLKKMDAFVTRNPKDYKKSNLLILSPEEALTIL